MQQSKCDIKYETLSPEHKFYKESYILLEGAINEVISRLNIIQKYRVTQQFKDPIEHYKTRIKSANSMKEKLRRKNLPVTVESALNKIHDAAGIRVICPFLDDIYWIVKMLKNQQDINVIKEKDYIHNPKPNGYRSYHMILQVPVHLENQVKLVYCEVQIRTIAMDSWASLEHQLKYKKNIPNDKTIVEELKRCADEIASTDLNLQTISDMIKEMQYEDGVDIYENFTCRR
ncbi:putative GTP pyrophosphokinase [Clostridium algifaecis]|uniref:GTP pyrophosphokinase n=1 Tax=Clostridium algifaecis TaxID=1472040 RepID=A0ABS4KPG1_9CLOT|nr:GTP pyrophosphokinase family protein [Clostridium algifaecis]MBP2031937.1 putative GTP pyrophosphokinase [Clostridium algifaecis]